MTESLWLRSAQHMRLWQYLGKRLTRRKRLLFGCGCARQTWHLLKKETNRRAVETSERYADGLATRKEMIQAWRALDWEPAAYCEWPITTVSGSVGYRAPDEDEVRDKHLERFPGQRNERARERDWCAVLRDLFGNPFRPVRLDPAWLAWESGTVPRLAQAIYDGHRFADMPFLGDALEEAGCADEQVLAHCRDKAPHYRGCWVVDLLLGRS
jgi:hypothetical protein